MNELYIYIYTSYIYIITGDIYIYIYIYMVVFQGFSTMIHVSAFLGFLRPYYGILWKESYRICPTAMGEFPLMQ